MPEILIRLYQVTLSDVVKDAVEAERRIRNTPLVTKKAG